MSTSKRKASSSLGIPPSEILNSDEGVSSKSDESPRHSKPVAKDPKAVASMATRATKESVRKKAGQGRRRVGVEAKFGDTVKTTLVLPAAVHETIDDIRHTNRRNKTTLNDIVLESLDLYFKKNGIETVEQQVLNAQSRLS